MNIEKQINEIIINEITRVDSIITAGNAYKDYLRARQKGDNPPSGSESYNTLVNACNVLLQSGDVTSENQQEVVKSDYSWYPHSLSVTDRILSILKHEGRAMRSPNLADKIKEIEGPDKGAETLKSYWYHVNNLLKTGALVSHKIDNNRWHNFLALSEWLAGKQLPEERYPTGNGWGNLPDSSRTFKGKSWKGGAGK